MLCNNKVKLGGLYQCKDLLLETDNIILLGCGTSLILLALLMLFGFVVKIKLPFLFQGLFLGFVGFSLCQYGKSEWKRNKKLKADGKVTKS